MAYTATAVWNFAPNWGDEVLERLEWRTSAMISEIGAEQRIPLRLTPRRSLEASFLIQKENRQYFQHLTGRNGASDWLIPLWHQVTGLGAAANSGTDTLTLDTRWREYKVGDMVILRNRYDARIWEAIEIESITDSTLILVSNLEKTWPKGTFVYPARLARLQDMVAGSKKTDELFEVKMQFSISEKNPYASEWTPDSTYQGAPVFDQRPDDSEDLTFEFKRYTSIVDNELGIPDLFDVAGRPFRKMQYRWSFAGREANHNFRQFLYYLKGRFRSVWIPTFMADLTIAANVVDDDDNITIKRVSYFDSDIVDLPWKDIMIEMRDGTVTYHRIVASSVIDADMEQIGLETPIAEGFTIAEVARISYMMKVRLDQDSIEINHAADTEGLTQTVVTWYELAADIPVEEEEEPVDVGTMWNLTAVDLSATTGFEVSGEAIFLPSEGEFLISVYKNEYANFAWERRSAEDFSHIADIDDFEDLWDADSPAIDDPEDNFVWIFNAYDPWYVYRINKADFSVDIGALSAFSIPGYATAYMAGGTMDTNYDRGRINPFDGTLWAEDTAGGIAIHRVSKDVADDFMPEVSHWLCGTHLDVVSPYTGVVSVVDYYEILAIQPDNLVFVSANDAYVNDYANSNIFHVNLTTGIATYVFQLYDDQGYRPVYYDTSNNTLWFFGEANLTYFSWMGETPPLARQSFKAWVVGSDPSTIVDYPIITDHQLFFEGTVGHQDIINRYTAAWIGFIDRINKGAWVGNNYLMPFNTPGTEGPMQARFFSFVERDIIAVCDNDLAVPYVNYDKGPWFGQGIEAISTTEAWSVPAGFGKDLDDYENQYAVKMTKGVPRVVETARYVRVIIEDTLVHGGTHASGLGGPCGLQEIEVHAELGGANVAVSVTADSTESGFPASNLLDGNLVDVANSWRAASATYPKTLTIDCGSLMPIWEVNLWPVNWRTLGTAPGWTAIMQPKGRFIAPLKLTIETSVDGSTWVTKRHYQNVYMWPLGLDTSVDASGCRVFEAF